MPSLSHPTDGHHARRRLPLLGWIFCAFSATAFAQPVTVASVESPGKVLRVSLQLDGGNPSYRVDRFGETVVDNSKLGFQRRDGRLDRDLAVVGQ